MKYRNGIQIQVEDQIQFDNYDTGKVVCDIGNSHYTEQYTKNNWSYLKEGILVVSYEIGLLHYPDEKYLDFSLKKRDVVE